MHPQSSHNFYFSQFQYLFTNMFKFVLLALLLATTKAGENTVRGLSSSSRSGRTVTLKITNLSFQQPFAPFFVMVHDSSVAPLFVLGQPALDELGDLAENGSPMSLVKYYEGMSGVDSVSIHNTDAPYFGGDTTEIQVRIPRNRLVTIASMAIHTNDCFVALNGVEAREAGSVYYSPGYDSGTEENNELCSSIPGPACGNSTGNSADANGEGFVHVHRGFFGLNQDEAGELSQAGYDWRNPMMRVEVV